jgi:hypothetical protein
MHETFPQPKRSELPIEQQANFEGSWTNLMIERLRDPEIKKQIIDLLFASEQMAKESPDFEEKYENGVRVIKEYIPLSRDKIEEEFEKRFKYIQGEIPLLPGSKAPHAGVDIEGKDVVNMYENWINPKTGEKPIEKVKNIAESHEKGHVIRKYKRRMGDEHSPYCLGEKFWKAFDFSAAQYTIEDCDDFRETDKKGLQEKNDDEIRKILMEYLMEPTELAERMSQLKNYFGITENERFTKEHLSYAREHYLKDTDFDNAMTQFFQAITPEKEDAFIEFINSAGI